MSKFAKILSRSALTALAAGMASSSLAATITYTLSGTGTATIGTVTQTGAFVATGIGDTATVGFPAGSAIPIVPLSSFTIAFGTNVYTATHSIQFFDNQSVNISGFTDTVLGSDVLDFTDGAFASYNAVSNIGPLSVGAGFTNTIATNAGALTFSGPSLTGLTFRAVVGTIGAVPEPATWAMMLAGFGIVGGAMRRRQRVSVRYA